MHKLACLYIERVFQCACDSAVTLQPKIDLCSRLKRLFHVRPALKNTRSSVYVTYMKQRIYGGSSVYIIYMKQLPGAAYIWNSVYMEGAAYMKQLLYERLPRISYKDWTWSAVIPPWREQQRMEGGRLAWKKQVWVLKEQRLLQQNFFKDTRQRYMQQRYVQNIQQRLWREQHDIPAYGGSAPLQSFTNGHHLQSFTNGPAFRINYGRQTHRGTGAVDREQ